MGQDLVRRIDTDPDYLHLVNGRTGYGWLLARHGIHARPYQRDFARGGQ